MLGLALAILAVIGLLAVILAALYNRLVGQRNLVQESWKQVDVELQRRYDLIPNLVETVKGYAAHEATTLDNVVAARNGAVAAKDASLEERQVAEGALGQALNGLLAVVENYPDLKASANFLELQQELSNTEDRIAAGRRFYNGNVRAYNTSIQSVPTNVIAGMFSFTADEYFEIDDPAVRQNVKVTF